MSIEGSFAMSAIASSNSPTWSAMLASVSMWTWRRVPGLG